MASDLILFGTPVAALAGAGYGVSARAARREAEAEARFPAIGQILDVGGVPVHAYVTGTGPDLVLIHGAGGNVRDMTFDLAGRLADRYRVIVLDRPGHGYTGLPPARTPERDSPRAQARLLMAAARLLGAERPLVLGHSFGGAVALAWALEAPDRVAALVVVSGASMPWSGKIKPSYRLNASVFGRTVAVPLITAFVPESYTDRALARVFGPQKIPSGYLAYFGLPLTLRRKSLSANSRQVIALRPHIVEMSTQYPSIRVPVEVLHGTVDTIVPLEVHAVPLTGLLPDAVLTRLPGIGHMPHHAVPEAVTDAIDRAAARARLR